MGYGARLRKLREQKGMTQSELAEKIGVHFTLISCYELGSKVPNLMVADRIAECFGVTIDSMVRDDKQGNM